MKNSKKDTVKNKKVIIKNHYEEDLNGRTGFVLEEEKFHYLVKLDNEKNPFFILGVLIRKNNVEFLAA